MTTLDTLIRLHDAADPNRPVGQRLGHYADGRPNLFSGGYDPRNNWFLHARWDARRKCYYWPQFSAL